MMEAVSEGVKRAIQEEFLRMDMIVPAEQLISQAIIDGVAGCFPMQCDIEEAIERGTRDALA